MTDLGPAALALPDGGAGKPREPRAIGPSRSEMEELAPRGSRARAAVGPKDACRDPRRGDPVPAAAHAACVGARRAAQDLLARLRGKPLTPFVDRERGVVVAGGRSRGAGAIDRVPLRGSSAAQLTRPVEREHARGMDTGETGQLAYPTTA